MLLHIPILAAFCAKVLDDDYRAGPETFCFAALPFLAALIDPAAGTAKPNDKLSLLCRAILAFGSAALLSLAAIWFFYRIYRVEDSGIGTAMVPGSILLLCTFVVIVTNLVVSVLFHDWPRSALLASFLAALLLLGAGQLLPKPEQKLPTRIMARFGFGVECETLLLTERGGRILRHQGIDVVLIPPARTKSVNPNLTPAPNLGAPQEKPAPANSAKKPQNRARLARVANVTILSRLGSEYLLRFETANGKKQISLPKKEIVSWAVRRED